MPPEKAPAFQFYADAFLTDENQAAMSLEQAGAYIRLMCYCWREQTIPNDPAKLARMVGTTPGRMRLMWPVIAGCFCPDSQLPERLRHARLDAEREKQADWREKSAAGGRKAQANRKHRSEGGSTTLPTNGQPTADTLSLVSSLPIKDSTPAAPDARFAQFWDAYPKKKGKDAAKAAFRKRKVSDALLEIILAAIAVQRTSWDWTKDGGRFIPNPATWLNQGRWDDEVEVDPALARKVGPDYHREAWVCLHDPECGSRVQHEERLEIERMKGAA